MRVIRNSLGQLIKPVGLQADTKKGIIMLSKPFNFLKNYKFVSFSILLSVLLTTGCSFTAKIENQPVSQLPINDERYTPANFVQQHPEGDQLSVGIRLLMLVQIGQPGISSKKLFF